jgi:TRAP-type transport system periplasmic protein
MNAPIKIRMGGYGPPTTGFSKALKLIGDKLQAEFGPRVAVEYVWNIMDHGYKAEDILTLVETGEMTLGYQSSSYLTDRVPELGFVDLPFLFVNNAQARGAMDGALGRHLAKKTEDRIDYRILGWFENGFRHISNKLRAIHLPVDMKDMKIRVLPSEIQKRTFELVSAKPMRMDLTEAIAITYRGRFSCTGPRSMRGRTNSNARCRQRSRKRWRSSANWRSRKTNSRAGLSRTPAARS